MAENLFLQGATLYTVAHEMFTTKLFPTNTPIADISDGLKAGGL